MKSNLFKTSICFLLLCGCVTQHKNQIKSEHLIEVPIKEHTVSAVLWQKHAAEYRALCHQAFNIASLKLAQMVRHNKSNKPLAVVTDIDETILNNTPYSVQLIEEDKHYDRASWKAWGERESAELVPGAQAFIELASSLGVEIFYVSNRYESQLDETIANLKEFGLANADKSHVYLKTDQSGKSIRRNMVSKTHEIVMLLGDNLSDFDGIYDNQNTKQRNQYAESMKSLFGHKFIVFPNPMYGDWETHGIYEGKQFSNQKQREMRFKKLKH